MHKKIVDIKTSFTAADSIPLKVLLDPHLVMHAKGKNRLLPIHIQILPTNKCNMNCSFCSCSSRDKDLEIDISLAKKIIDKCKKAGTKAVTITGGGEPLMYPYFAELLDYFHMNSIKIGLVTNGLLLHKIPKETLDKITWCRISNDDHRTLSGKYREHLSLVVKRSSKVD